MDVISADDFMICDFQIPGFSLFDKKWCFFAVDFISDVEFNDTAFKQLLLPKNHKELVHALVKNHGSDDFDDLIKGKGKGLVFVLHGAPGVGKTFTAESIADNVRKPLYVVSSGELGVEPVSNGKPGISTFECLMMFSRHVFPPSRNDPKMAIANSTVA